MPRDTQRKTTRARVADPALRDPRIDEHTRFITARGDRNGVATANALKAAFGVGEDFLNKRTVRLNIEGEQQAVQDEALGKDQDLENTNLGYMRGWSKLQADNDFINAEADFQDHLRGLDFENMDEEEVRGAYDGFMQDRFGGAELEPEYAAQLSPQLLELEQATIVAHKDLVFKNTQAKQGAMLVENLEHILKISGEFNYDYLAAETGRIWDGAEKNEQYKNVLFMAAMEAADPRIIENMPEKYPSGQPTIKNRPEYQKQIDSAIKATIVEATKRSKEAEDAFKAEFQTDRAIEHSYGQQLANAGDDRTIAFVVAGGEDGPNGEPRLLTRSQQKSLLDSYYSQKLTGALNGSLKDDWAAGNGISYTQDEVDRAASEFVQDAAVQAAVADLPPEERKVALQRAVVERSVVNGPAPMPSFIKDGMEVNVNNPEKFKEALALYRYTEAQLPGYAKTQISDESARVLSSFERLVEDYGSEQRAMEAISQMNWQNVTDNKKAISNEADKLTSALNDKPWSVFSYNDPTLMASATKEIEHYVALGYDIEQAGVAADRHIRSRYTVVQDRYWSANAGWGNNPEVVSTWAIANEAIHQGVAKDQISIRPHPQQPNVAIIRNVGSALPGFAVEVATLTSGYEQSQRDLLVIATQLAEDDKDAYDVAVNRAKSVLTPLNPYMDSSMRAEAGKRREGVWKSLTDAERQRLILQQIE